jgi:hypothetical protein
VSEAWFGFLGVIVGAVVSLLGEQFATRREREARQALRHQERTDRRDTFQRETILALQDALAEFLPLVLLLRPKPGPPPTNLLLENAEVSELHWRINMLSARLFDDELRSLVKSLRDEIRRTALEADLDAMETRAREANRLTNQMYDRMNTLLRELS